MKGNNPVRDLSKTVGGTTPVNYRSSGAVYRSLSAAPTQISVERTQTTEIFGQQKGEVVWTESKNLKTSVTNKDVRPLPIPLIVANAPHNSLFLESNPVSKVIAEVHSLFEQNDVDFEFNETKFKWKCVCYDDRTETRFVSCLFSVPDKPNYFVLDFQRRSGDAFHFQSIYKAIHFKLVKSAFVVSCGDKKTLVAPEIRTFKPMALPDDFFTTDDKDEEEKDSKEYEPLCKMCLSQYIDVQREGLMALAGHCEKSASARVCLAPFAEKLVDAVNLSRDVHVRRLATSALRAISEEKSSHRFIKEKGGSKALANVLLNEQELVETRRQAGKVLCNLSDLGSDVTNSIKNAPIAKDARLCLILKELQSRED